MVKITAAEKKGAVSVFTMKNDTIPFAAIYCLNYFDFD